MTGTLWQVNPWLGILKHAHQVVTFSRPENSWLHLPAIILRYCIIHWEKKWGQNSLEPFLKWCHINYVKLRYGKSNSSRGGATFFLCICLRAPLVFYMSTGLDLPYIFPVLCQLMVLGFLFTFSHKGTIKARITLTCRHDNANDDGWSLYIKTAHVNVMYTIYLSVFLFSDHIWT